MAALEFPENPVLNQTYDFPPFQYIWDGVKWKTVGRGADTVAEAINAHKSAVDQHSIAGVNGLQAALDGKQSASPVLSAIAQATMGAFSHRNLLINGDFRVWQRSNINTNITAANAYIADRWLVSVGGTIAVNTETLLVGADRRNVLLIFGATAGASATIMQRIEASNVAHLVGKQVTFSVEVHSNAARSCALYIAKPAGTTKDDWSSSAGGTQVESKVISVTPSINRFFITHTVTNDDVKNGISVQVYTGSLAVNDYVALSEAQFEEGGVATPFEHRPYGYELSLCQRYYRFVKGFAWTGYVSAPGYVAAYYYFDQPMRTSPTVTWNRTYVGNTGNPSYTPEAPMAVQNVGFRLTTQCTSGAGGYDFAGDITCTAEL